MELKQLAVRVKVLQGNDSISKAAEAVVTSPFGAAPVVEDGIFVGFVTADRLSDYVAAREELDLEAVATQGSGLVRDLELERGVALPGLMDIEDAHAFLRHNEVPGALVTEANGDVIGAVSLAALVNALCGRVKPALIGGMATPFGVYLTGGGARGGAGDFALAATGVFIASMHAISALLAEGLLRIPHQASALNGTADWLQALNPEQSELVFVLVSTLIFALIFRFSWITGFHAAEHQVVHALEKGEDLRREVVAAQPRVHPRCGTNLVAGMMLLLMLLSIDKPVFDIPALRPVLHALAELNPLLAVLTTVFLWRRFGGWLQQHVTTKPANAAQLDSALKAATELLERYRVRSDSRRPVLQRIWQMGMLQVLCGYLLTVGVVYVLGLIAPLPEGLSRLW